MFRAVASRDRGFSLLEVLVATALTGLLIAGSLGMFVSWRSSASSADRRWQADENGHRALLELGEAVRSAGYSGCSSTPSFSISTLAAERHPELVASPLQGFDSPPTGWERDLLAGAAPNSDVLLVRRPRRHTTATRLTSRMRSTRDALRVANPETFRPVGSIALATSCDAHAYFVVTAIEQDSLEHGVTDHSIGMITNLTDDLLYQFDAGADVLPIDVEIYYVGTLPDSTEPALLRSNAGKLDVVAAGIEDLQLEFDLDLDGDGTADTHRTAAKIDDWGTVVSVSMALRSFRGTFAEDAMGTGEFRTVVAIRNRS